MLPQEGNKNSKSSVKTGERRRPRRQNAASDGTISDQSPSKSDTNHKTKDGQTPVDKNSSKEHTPEKQSCEAKTGHHRRSKRQSTSSGAPSKRNTSDKNSTKNKDKSIDKRGTSDGRGKTGVHKQAGVHKQTGVKEPKYNKIPSKTDTKHTTRKKDKVGDTTDDKTAADKSKKHKDTLRDKTGDMAGDKPGGTTSAYKPKKTKDKLMDKTSDIAGGNRGTSKGVRESEEEKQTHAKKAQTGSKRTRNVSKDGHRQKGSPVKVTRKSKPEKERTKTTNNKTIHSQESTTRANYNHVTRMRHTAIPPLTSEKLPMTTCGMPPGDRGPSQGKHVKVRHTKKSAQIIRQHDIQKEYTAAVSSKEIVQTKSKAAKQSVKSGSTSATSRVITKRAMSVNSATGESKEVKRSTSKLAYSKSEVNQRFDRIYSQNYCPKITASAAPDYLNPVKEIKRAIGFINSPDSELYTAVYKASIVMHSHASDKFGQSFNSSETICISPMPASYSSSESSTWTPYSTPRSNGTSTCRSDSLPSVTSSWTPSSTPRSCDTSTWGSDLLFSVTSECIAQSSPRSTDTSTGTSDTLSCGTSMETLTSERSTTKGKVTPQPNPEPEVCYMWRPRTRTICT